MGKKKGKKRSKNKCIDADLSKLDPPDGGIADPKLKLQQDQIQYFNFSFKYCQENSKFNLSNIDPQKYLHKFILKLIEISKLKVSDCVGKRLYEKSLRFHPNPWENTSESEGFKFFGNEQLKMLDCWQFAISKGNIHGCREKQEGRVHGFILQNTFFVVWFDPGHQLIPMERK